LVDQELQGCRVKESDRNFVSENLQENATCSIAEACKSGYEQRDWFAYSSLPPEATALFMIAKRHNQPITQITFSLMLLSSSLINPPI